MEVLAQRVRARSARGHRVLGNAPDQRERQADRRDEDRDPGSGRELRERREEMLDQFDLGGIYDEINETLDDVVSEERDAIEDHVGDAADSGDERASEIAGASSVDKNLQLDMLPPDLAGKVRGLQSYEFVSSEAREQFERRVLESDDYYNGIINVRVGGSKILKEELKNYNKA